MRQASWLLGFVLTGCVHYEPKPIALDAALGRLESRSLADESLRRFLVAGLGHGFPDWPPGVWDFESLSWVAFYYHPSLEVARAQWGIARGGLQSAAGRPNPTVSVSPGYNFNAANGVSPWFPGVSFDWPVETAGKRGKRMSRASYLAEAARQSVTSAAWQVRSGLRQAVIEVVLAAGRAEALQHQLTAQREILGLLEQRLAAGRSTSLELSAPRLALVKLQADASDARRVEVEAKSRLAEALGLTESGASSLRVQYPFDAPIPTSAVLAAARRSALQTRADILAALAAYESSQANLQLEIARQYPDVRLGSGYQWDQGESKWNLALSVELPLLNRNQGPIAEAEARRREAGAHLMALQLKVLTEIDRAATGLRTSSDQLAENRRVQAALSERHKLTAERLAAGAGDQLELQLTKAELAAGELLLLEGEARVARAAGQLEDALQVPFPRIQQIEQTSGLQSNTN